MNSQTIIKNKSSGSDQQQDKLVCRLKSAAFNIVLTQHKLYEEKTTFCSLTQVKTASISHVHHVTTVTRFFVSYSQDENKGKKRQYTE
jgi:hypothetical protein